jgi:hypothetical protein
MQVDAANGLHFDLFSKIFSGGEQKVRRTSVVDPPPPAAPRLYRINKLTVVSRVADPSNATKLCFIAQAELTLSDFAKSTGVQELNSTVRLRWKVAENNENGVIDPDLVEDSNDQVPGTFSRTGEGEYSGLVKDSPLTFRWTSASFSNDWKVMPELFVEEQ